MIRILIADDHAVVRQGIRQMLALGSDLAVTGEARDGWEVMERLKSGDVDLLVTDMSMPGLSGLNLIKRVKELWPSLSVLVLSMHGEAQVAARAIKAGANGYVTKDCEPEALLEAVRRVARGGRAISSGLAEKLVFEGGGTTDAAPSERLSDREYEVFLRLIKGERLSEIAESLHLSPKTVSTHKMRILQKLELKSAADLVRYAMKQGFLS